MQHTWLADRIGLRVIVKTHPLFVVLQAADMLPVIKCLKVCLQSQQHLLLHRPLYT